MLGIGDDRKGKGSTENFQSANAVRDTPVLDTGHYMLVPNHRRYNTKGDPNANHGLGVITHQCKFIDYKKRATLMGDGENVGSYTGVGAGGIGEISIQEAALRQNCQRITGQSVHLGERPFLSCVNCGILFASGRP